MMTGVKGVSTKNRVLTKNSINHQHLIVVFLQVLDAFLAFGIHQRHVHFLDVLRHSCKYQFVFIYGIRNREILRILVIINLYLSMLVPIDNTTLLVLHIRHEAEVRMR